MGNRRHRPPSELAEVTETAHARRRVHGGNAELPALECWEAVTTDGTWLFTRDEGARTDWEVYHRPSIADGSFTGVVTICGSLECCQACAFDGVLDKELRYRREEAEAERRRPGGIVWVEGRGVIPPEDRGYLRAG
jgi:hypothetical protein